MGGTSSSQRAVQQHEQPPVHVGEYVPEEWRVFFDISIGGAPAGTVKFQVSASRRGEKGRRNVRGTVCDSLLAWRVPVCCRCAAAAR